MSVKVENLSFKYNKKLDNTLINICTEFKESSVNIILGLNGCGKTTLIKTLVGLFRTYEGKVLYDDIDLKDMSYKERSKTFSYVSQSIRFIDDVLVKDYLTFGMVNELKIYETPSKEQINRVYEVAKKFNILNLLESKMGEISGGQRQIICLCASLLQQTKVIVLDEPTSALDLKNQNLVLNALKEIAHEENKIIILSSHNPNHALFMNSNVLLMSKGRIVKSGNATDIITVDNLKEIYGENICLSKNLDYNEISFKDADN